MAKEYLDTNGLTYFWNKLKNYFQEKLVSGTNIKTVNNQSLLGSGNITTDTDSGWSSAEWGSDFTAYTTGYPARYRKINGIVEFVGVAKPTATIAGSTTAYTLITLPEGYRPIRERDYVMQGSGNAIWTMRVYPDGRVTFERFRDMGSASGAYKQVTNTTWLPFNATFIAD